MIIGICLGILILISFISVIFGNSFIGLQSSIGIDSTAIVDGESSTFIIENIPYTLNIDSLTGLLVILTILITLSAILGFNLLGSGLNSTSTHIITVLTAYISLWTIFSLLSFSLIVSIDTFGGLLYIGLTVGYAYGVIQNIVSSGN